MSDPINEDFYEEEEDDGGTEVEGERENAKVEVQKLSELEVLEMLAAKHRLQDAGKIVHIGIIDYLTNYTKAKQVEKWAKSMSADAATVSVAHPNDYGQRFKTWITENVL